MNESLPPLPPVLPREGTELEYWTDEQLERLAAIKQVELAKAKQNVRNIELKFQQIVAQQKARRLKLFFIKLSKKRGGEFQYALQVKAKNFRHALEVAEDTLAYSAANKALDPVSCYIECLEELED